MKKYIHFIPALNPGGAEIALLNFVKSNQKTKHIIITFSKGSMDREFEKFSQISQLTLFDLFLFLKNNSFSQTDTIICWMYHSAALILCLFRVLGLKQSVLVSLHHSSLTRKGLGWKSFVSSRLMALMYNKKSTKFIFCGHDGYKKHIKIFNLPEINCFVLHNIILDLGKFKFVQNKGDSIKLVYVGRWHKVKNIKGLVNLVSILRHHFPVELTVIGSGLTNDNYILKKWIEECQVSDFIHLRGYQSDLNPFYENAEILVITSLTESYPNVAVEAITCGCKVWSTRVGDIPNIVGVAGVVLDCEIDMINKAEVLSSFEQVLSINEENLLTQKEILGARHSAEAYLIKLEGIIERKL